MTSCEHVYEKYDDEQLFSLAYTEFNALKENRQLKNLNMNTIISRNGALYCFCE